MTRIYTIAALLTGGSLTHLFRMRTTHFPESWIQDLTAAQQREELEKRGERALLKKRER